MKLQHCSSEMSSAGRVSPAAASRPPARLCPAGGAVWAAACWSLRDPSVCTRRTRLHCSAENRRSRYSLRGEEQLQSEQQELVSPHLRKRWKRNRELWRKCMCVLLEQSGKPEHGQKSPCFHFQTQGTVQDEKATSSRNEDIWLKKKIPLSINPCTAS